MAAEESENRYHYMGLCLVFFGFCALLAITYICKRCSCDSTARTVAIHYDEGETGEEKTCAEEEIDSMRAATILRCLNGFTLRLKEEHMLCLSRTETCETALMTCDDDEEEEGNLDIEVGSKGELADPSEKEISKGDSVECTHISIPLPGHDVRGDYCVEIKEKEQSTTCNNPVTKQIANETRVAPIFCAVCHAKYKLSERVCWASNAECSHVFHEDCVLQWLVSLGRRRTMGQHFDKSSSEEELMKYQPECPYCRQHFIDRRLMMVNDNDRV